MKPDQKAALTESSLKKDDWLNEVQKQVSSLRFGVVQIVVHDSQVVQIERTEKIRLNRSETE